MESAPGMPRPGRPVRRIAQLVMVSLGQASAELCSAADEGVRPYVVRGTFFSQLRKSFPIGAVRRPASLKMLINQYLIYQSLTSILVKYMVMLVLAWRVH